MDYVRPRSGYQPCDTFFVEEDLRAQAERQAKQEHDKLVNRERQYAMATQLSRLTSDEYRDDAVQHMMEMDVSGSIRPSMGWRITCLGDRRVLTHVHLK